MDEYIKREEAYRVICSDETMSGYEKAYCSDLIRNIPAADVATVVHGRWIEQEKYTFGVMYDCSICGNRILDNGNSWNYCPNRGAKMDRGTD